MSSLTPSSDSASPRRTRQRARKACLPCRQRKRKCDNRFPCSSCTIYTYKCQYPRDDGPTAAFVDHPPPAASHRSPEEVSASVDNSVRTTTTTTLIPPQRHVSTDRGILDPVSSRYMSQHSAVAFPHSLGLSLQSANPPSLHSFAWNCGVRPELGGVDHISVKDIVSAPDMRRFLDAFFTSVHPIFTILPAAPLRRKCEAHWSHGIDTWTLADEALASIVIALGSLFSLHEGHPKETEIEKHVKEILEDPPIMRRATLWLVIVWCLRTVYLRAVTRPHIAWLTACTTMHLAEATGLHHETENVMLTNESPSNDPAYSLENDRNELARRTFWTAWMVHSCLCNEYGRTGIVLRNITCKLPQAVPDSCLLDHIQLAKCLPEDCTDSCQHITAEERTNRLLDSLHAIQSVPSSHPFMVLCKADMSFCLYRRLRVLSHSIPKPVVTCLLQIGDEALDAAQEFSHRGQPWWNILFTSFQYVCVLLALDSRESLARVSKAMRYLGRIAEKLDTHMGREALTTARILVQDAAKKKKIEAALLEEAEPAPPSNATPPNLHQQDNNTAADYHGNLHGGGNGMEGVVGSTPGAAELPHLNLDWDCFFETTGNTPFFPQMGNATGDIGMDGFPAMGPVGAQMQIQAPAVQDQNHDASPGRLPEMQDRVVNFWV